MILRSKISSKCALAAMVLASVSLSAPAAAATQGTMGATSTGSAAISASVPNRARISGLVDVAFTNVNPTATASRSQNVCVWSNTATRSYTVTATGSGAGNTFRLANGAQFVPYAVRWNAASGQTTGTVLTRGVASAVMATTATHQSCASGPATTSSLNLRITAANLSLMQAQTTYSGTLTLVITPQ